MHALTLVGTVATHGYCCIDSPFKELCVFNYTRCSYSLNETSVKYLSCPMKNCEETFYDHTKLRDEKVHNVKLEGADKENCKYIVRSDESLEGIIRMRFYQSKDVRVNLYL